MGRYKASVGGWCRLWTRLWLSDEKVRLLSDAEQGKLIRVLCVGNECLAGGRFEVIGIPLTKEQVADKARVDVEFIEKLQTPEIGFLTKKPFGIRNWERYQNPDSKKE